MPAAKPPLDLSSGQVIHQLHSDRQAISVLAQPQLRLLQFGHDAIQSALDPAHPQRLVLPHLDAIMAWRLFGGHCRQSLLLGLGGGDIARYLLHYYPDCHLDAVERDEAVIKISRDFFALPDTPRLTVYVDDAANFLRFSDTTYDLLILDLYHDGGQPWQHGQHTIYSACHRHLSDDGILVINLLPTDTDNFTAVLQELRQLFDGRTLCITVSGYQNIVILGFKKRPATVDRAGLEKLAQTLTPMLGVNYTELLEEVLRSNPLHDNCLIL